MAEAIVSPVLEVRGLVKRFGGLVATNNVSFELAEGEALGLIGPNGAGKTTIFSLIMGELRQTDGSIRYRGHEISALSTPGRIALGIGRTYQIPRPFPALTVRENIRVGLMPDSLLDMIFKGPDETRESELAQSVGLGARDLDRSASALAMGDLRKLEFARTLATGARTLLLDEVFAGLTKGETAMIANLIQDLRARGFTLLMVSHDLPAMEPLIDRAIAIDRGTLLARGQLRRSAGRPGRTRILSR